MTGPWHDTMNENDKYRRDSLDGGTTWGDPYQFKGTDGAPGSDASVNFDNVEAVLRKYYNISATEITGDTVAAPKIYGAELFGANIYAGDGSGSFAQMDGDGFYVFVKDVDSPKISMRQESGGAVQLILGAGSSPSYPDRGRFSIIKSGAVSQIKYVTPSGVVSGFSFNDNGTISVSGELEGVHAVFA